MSSSVLTSISTSSKMMQFISRTPGATRTFADIETLGPICSHSNSEISNNGREAYSCNNFRLKVYEESLFMKKGDTEFIF